MSPYCGNNPSNRSDNCGDFWSATNESLANNIIEIATMMGMLYSCYLMLDEDKKVLVATIAAEAAVTANGEPVSSQARQAMANVALNRVGSREWSRYSSVSEICQYTGFDGYNTPNYNACLDYTNHRDFSNTTYESIIWDVAKAYVYDITQGCQLYYTPAAMDPPGSIPGWNFDILTEVYVYNVDTYYEARFFKYS